jgi:hypothetical protein
MGVSAMGFDLSSGARLVESLYQPARSTVSECLARWHGLEPHAQVRCYLIIDGEQVGARQTLNGGQIAELSIRLS